MVGVVSYLRIEDPLFSEPAPSDAMSFLNSPPEAFPSFNNAKARRFQHFPSLDANKCFAEKSL